MSIRAYRATALAVAAALSLAPAAGWPAAPSASVAAQAPVAVARVLAPTGTLLIGVYPGAPTSLVKDAKTGEARGVTVDLGRELGRRLGVPVRLVEFDRVAQVVEALGKGEIDFTVTNSTPARAQTLDFSEPVIEIELGYLALPGSPVTAIAAVDRPGIRVGVTEGSTTFGTLSSQFKDATLVQAPSLEAAAQMLRERKVDAYATNKSVLFELADNVPGARVLDGYWGLEHMAVAIPKGREAGLAYARAFAQSVKADGQVARAVARAGLRGARTGG